MARNDTANSRLRVAKNDVLWRKRSEAEVQRPKQKQQKYRGREQGGEIKF